MKVCIILQDRHFSTITSILFDGESALASSKAKKVLKDKYNVQLRAEGGFKRMQAERCIRELKIRVSVALELKSTVFFKGTMPRDFLISLL